MSRRVIGEFLAGIVVAAVAIAPAAAQDAGAPALGREQVLVVGRVTHSAFKHQPRVEAFADWLAGRLAGVGIRAGRAVIARSREEMVTFLRRGRVDVVEESVLTALSYEDEAGARIVAHEWRRGRPYYKTVFIARRDGGLYSLKDLVGRRIAFEDAGSTTSFFLPLALMMRAGLEPVALSSPESAVPPGRVGYVFARSEANISAWVASGIVDAGAYSGRDWDRDDTNPERYRKKMQIFHMSEPILRSTLSVRRDLDPKIERALMKALAEFESAPEAVAVRKQYYGVTRFAPIDGRLARELKEAREIYRLIRPLVR